METDTKNNKFSLRRESRILAVQWVYMCRSNEVFPSESSFQSICLLMGKDPSSFTFTKELVFLLKDHVKEIDSLIERFATNWTLNRVSSVELCILRLAVCELLYRPDIPPIVTINEAIELGKLFSGEDSKSFINGVLDRVKNTLSRSLRSAS